MPASSMQRHARRRHSSSSPPACAVASSRTPQLAAADAAARSASAVISSIASTCGDIARSRSSAPSPFGAPVSTSVHGPTSNCSTPPHTPATSPRSSASATRTPRSDRLRTISRSSVVFPAPGGDNSSVSAKPPSSSLGSTIPAHPGTARGTRMHTDVSRRMPHTAPSRTEATPHSPTRTPPRAVTNPLRMLSAAVCTDPPVAQVSTHCRSCSVTARNGSGRSPSASRTDGAKPVRSRSSSPPARTASGMDRNAPRSSRGSSAAAFANACMDIPPATAYDCAAPNRTHIHMIAALPPISTPAHAYGNIKTGKSAREQLLPVFSDVL